MELEQTLEKLDIKDGDTILLRGELDRGEVEDISRHVQQHVAKNVTIICLHKGYELSVMNEKDMNAAGWYKK